MNTSTFKHLAQNTQARQALTWAAQNPDEALRLIGEISHNYHRDIDARNAENLGALIDRDPKAKDIFDRAIDRMSWHDKKAELRSMPLNRSRYAADDLARDVAIFQSTRDGQDRLRNAWGKTLAALGGKTFLDQIGAKQFESHNAEIRFSVPRSFTKGGIDNVRIDIDPAGNYVVDFRAGPDLVETRKGVKPEQLPVVFADVTGLK
jgi:hypothetical protein